MKKLPTFLNHLSEKKRNNSGYEAIQDFFISWTIRCAEKRYSDSDPIVHGYAKKILSKLIFEKSFVVKDQNIDYDFMKRISFNKVVTQRQFERIDILAEIEYELDGKVSKVILSIENKWYTLASRNQLESYSKILEKNFGNRISHLEKVLIYIDDSLVENNQVSMANEFSYKIFQIGELFDKKNNPPSENELFDSYWFTDYGLEESKELKYYK